MDHHITHKEPIERTVKNKWQPPTLVEIDIQSNTDGTVACGTEVCGAAFFS